MTLIDTIVISAVINKMSNFTERIEKHLNQLVERYPELCDCRQSIRNAYCLLEECYKNEGKLMIAGNGGSAADSEHIAGELMKRFKDPRPITKEMAERLKEIDPVRGTWLSEKLECALPAIPLVAHEAISTAYSNDVDSTGVFAQQLFGIGRSGDVFLGISTSGNSKNVVFAAILAKALGIKVIGLTGAQGGELATFSDVVVKVPQTETFMIQELHMPIYHCWCLMLEERFFGDAARSFAKGL